MPAGETQDSGAPRRALVKPQVKAFLMESQPPRIPGSRELFLALRLLCAHPIIWNGDKFVPSGTIAVCILYAVALSALGSCLMWDSSSTQLLFKFDHNPIESDMGAFVAVLSFGEYIMGSVVTVAFVRCRAQVASAFNELHSFWLTFGRPRQKSAFVAFAFLIWSPCSMALSLHELFQVRRSFPITDLVFASHLSSVLGFFFVLNLVSVALVLMIFAYGTIIECLPNSLDSLRTASNKDYDGGTSLDETLSSLQRLLSSLSSAVSPLIATGSMALACPLLQLMFFSILHSHRGGSVAQSLISCGLGAFLFIALALSQFLGSRISGARHSLRERFYLNELSPVIFQRLNYKLENLSHPIRVLAVFKFDARFALSVMIFFLNFYMTFIQFKAIMASHSTNGTQVP